MIAKEGTPGGGDGGAIDGEGGRNGASFGHRCTISSVVVKRKFESKIWRSAWKMSMR